MAFFVPRFAFAPARCHAPAASQRDFAPFLSLLDDAINEINKTQHHRQRPLVNHRFDVRETEHSYEVDGELPGFSQQDIEIEFTNDQTLVIRGKSEQQTTPAQVADAQPINNAAAEQVPASPVSETSSVKSHQPTVEDDFEDLGDENSSTKGKEAALAPEPSPKPVQQQPSQIQKAAQQQPQTQRLVSERRFGSLSRTFTFPVRLNTDAAVASLKNGVLSLVIPKAPVQEARRIQIA